MKKFLTIYLLGIFHLNAAVFQLEGCNQQKGNGQPVILNLNNQSIYDQFTKIVKYYIPDRNFLDYNNNKFPKIEQGSTSVDQQMPGIAVFIRDDDHVAESTINSTTSSNSQSTTRTSSTSSTTNNNNSHPSTTEKSSTSSTTNNNNSHPSTTEKSSTSSTTNNNNSHPSTTGIAIDKEITKANNLYLPNGIVLMAKKEPFIENQLFEQEPIRSSFGNITNMSHTERQLLKALLDRNDIDKTTKGSVWIFTDSQPCHVINSDGDNQNIACVEYYKILKEKFKNITFNVFFRDCKISPSCFLDVKIDNKTIDQVKTVENNRQFEKVIVSLQNLNKENNIKDFMNKFKGFRINDRDVLQSYPTSIGMILTNADTSERKNIISPETKGQIYKMLLDNNGNGILKWDNVKLANKSYTDPMKSSLIKCINGEPNIAGVLFNDIYKEDTISYHKIQ